MPETKIWGDYEVRLDQIVGRGGMGTVYRGRQISLNRPVAIKTLKKELANQEFVRRFHRESNLLARLIDSHVVQVFGAGDGDGTPYYAMEFVEGEDLASMLRKGRKFTPEELLDITVQTGLALKAAWRLKIVHRDIKPSNILVTRDKVVKVMDFGLAKNPDMDLTRTEMIMGTAKYISPEQATGGEVDIRADLYSLGCVIYELATGNAPFLGDSPTAVIYQHVHKTPAPPRAVNPALPEALQGLILRCLAKRAEERYQSPDDLIADARAIQQGVSPDERTVLLAQVAGAVPGRSPSTARAAVPARSSGRLGFAAALFAAVAVIGVGAYLFIRALSRPPGPEVPHLSGTNGTVLPGTTTNGGTSPVVDPVPATTTVTDPPPMTEDQIALELETARRDIDLERYEKSRNGLKLLLRLLGAEDPRRPEAQRLLNLCEFRETLAAARAKADEQPDVAIEAYERALKLLPPGEDGEMIRATLLKLRFKKFRDSGARRMGSDWVGAAEDFTEAAKWSDERERNEMLERAQFCRRYDLAMRKMASDKDYAGALEVFEALRSRHFGFESDLLLKIGECRRELERATDARRAETGKLIEIGRAAFQAGRWKEAWEHLRRARDAGAERTAGFDRLLRHAEAAGVGRPGMVFVPAGPFTFGAGAATDVSGPQREVETGAFFIDVREVTNAEYRKFVDAYQGHALCHKEEPEEKRRRGHAPEDWGADGSPVVTVDWFDAWAYAAWAGKRLPTEMEWEKAAGTEPTGGKRRVYPWGDAYGQGDGESPCGALGMGSGLFDWIADAFERYPGGIAWEPYFGKGRRCVRGGILSPPGFKDAEQEAKVTYRHSYPPDFRTPKIGIRGVVGVD